MSYESLYPFVTNELLSAVSQMISQICNLNVTFRPMNNVKHNSNYIVFDAGTLDPLHVGILKFALQTIELSLIVTGPYKNKDYRHHAISMSFEIHGREKDGYLRSADLYCAVGFVYITESCRLYTEQEYTNSFP